MDSTRGTATTISIDGAIRALTLTSSGYLLAFFFDGGYLTFFGIPLEFAEVSMRNLLLCLASSGVVAMFIIHFDMGWFLFRPKSLDPGVAAHVRVHIHIIFLAFMFTLLVGIEPSTIFLLVVVVCSALITFLQPLLANKKHPTYAAKMAIADQVDEKYKGGASKAVESFLLRLPTDYALILLFTLAAIPLSWGLGYYRARVQKDFPMVEGDQPCVAIRLRTEGMLCAGVRSASLELTGEFRFYDQKTTTFRVVRLGQLGHRYSYTGAPVDDPK